MPGARKNQIARDPELARLGTLYKVAKTSYSGLSAHAFQPLTVFLSLSLSLSLSLPLSSVYLFSSLASSRHCQLFSRVLFYFTQCFKSCIDLGHCHLSYFSVRHLSFLPPQPRPLSPLCRNRASSTTESTEYTMSYNKPVRTYIHAYTPKFCIRNSANHITFYPGLPPSLIPSSGPRRRPLPTKSSSRWCCQRLLRWPRPGWLLSAPELRSPAGLWLRITTATAAADVLSAAGVPAAAWVLPR